MVSQNLTCFMCTWTLLSLTPVSWSTAFLMTRSVDEASYWAVTMAFWIFHLSINVVLFSTFTSTEMHFYTFHFLMPFSRLFFLGTNLELFVSSAVSLDILVILCQEFSLSHSPWEPWLWDWCCFGCSWYLCFRIRICMPGIGCWLSLFFFSSNLFSFSEKEECFEGARLYRQLRC